MTVDLFSYQDYKEYLKDKLESQSRRGQKLSLAEHIGCQPSYLSQVLNGRPDLSAEQGARLNSFFHHSQLESRYFVVLVELARAGTTELKEIFRSQIVEMQDMRFNLKKRLKKTDDLPENAHQTYYSTWYYAAIHVALSVPELQTVDKISALYNLPPSLVKDAIAFLEDVGLIEKNKNGYSLSKKRIFLGRDSAFIQRHHINWRSQALQSAEKNLREDMHYSNVIAIAEEDFVKIKDIFLRAIENARAVIGPSQEEKVYAITLDIFKI